ncbi:hypothetical protein [Sediminibacter sp. Hel_I_10]|uniref:hypothetical protein n=1 Tax=Sediminibacter sp. Hel_I_10 TaxID=1392490 RepID=UPI00047BBF7E|nr:hypothetical protein [Sediminibacter sp. Hel_I_10]
MKTVYTLLILINLFIFSCGEDSKQTPYAAHKIVDSLKINTPIDLKGASIAPISELQNSKNPISETGLKTYTIMNSQFKMVYGIMPIPKSWKEVNNRKKNVLFEGPNGVKVYGELFKSFYYSNNSQMNAYAQQRGSEVKPPKSVERIINEEFKPFLAPKNIKLTNQFELPQIANDDKQRNDAMFKSTPENKQFQCIATEWEDHEGNKSIIIIRYFTNQYTAIGGMDWGYTVNVLDAPEPYYEQAKKDYIRAISEIQVNPNWLQTNNQYWAQKTQQGNIEHNNRMAAIENQGRIMRDNAKVNSSILDDSYNSWKRRNAMTDAGQSKTINGIWERNTMVDQGGNQYQVDGYYDQVYKGTNDQYIGANNGNWNPNVDSSTNEVNWEQLEYEDQY